MHTGSHCEARSAYTIMSTHRGDDDVDDHFDDDGDVGRGRADSAKSKRSRSVCTHVRGAAALQRCAHVRRQFRIYIRGDRGRVLCERVVNADERIKYA